MAKIDKEEFIAFLEERISDVDSLLGENSRFSPEFHKWQTTTKRILARQFGESSQEVEDFEKVPFKYTGVRVIDDNYDKKVLQDFRNGLLIAKQVLTGIVDEVEEIGLPGQDSSITDKGGSVTNFYNTQIQTQTTNIQIQIEKVLQEELTPEQFEEFKAILASSDERAKGNKLSEFIKGLGETAKIAILKSVILAQNTGL